MFKIYIYTQPQQVLIIKQIHTCIQGILNIYIYFVLLGIKYVYNENN